MIKIRRALISVSSREGVKEFALFLQKQGIEIISTSGTLRYLQENGVQAISVEEFTHSPECFGGRLKTVGVPILGALLFRRDNPQDLIDAQNLKIKPIDMVVCNFYPFREAKLKTPDDLDQLIQMIDIGGPTMVRSAAKNYKSVAVITSPEQYPQVSQEMENNQGSISEKSCLTLSIQAFSQTLFYEKEIATTLASFDPSHLHQLRYGENPHQQAFILTPPLAERNFDIKKIQGKELSYNNYLDFDAANSLLFDLQKMVDDHQDCPPKIAVIVKHLTPCGVAASKKSLSAITMALEGDPKSAFGGIFAFNFEIGEEEANLLKPHFIEIILAPSFSESALKILQAKKGTRLLKCSPTQNSSSHKIELKTLATGQLLCQTEDNHSDNEFINKTISLFPKEKIPLARFGIKICKWCKSNAVILVQEKEGDFSLIGAGMGQPNRIDALQKLAIPRAQEKSNIKMNELILISDAFFPFADALSICHQFDIRYLVQPGGSIRDDEIIDQANQYQMAMLFTNTRHFRH